MFSFLRAALLGIVVLTGCAGDHSPPIRFVNGTRHSDAQLWSLWRAAQQTLSRQIDLNPVQRLLQNAPPEILPGDARAWAVSPYQLLVAPKPDVLSAALYAATGIQRTNPTGLIACPQPCNVRFAPAYSLYSPPMSGYAASWEFSGNNFDFLVQYEFENQILKTLGYDVSWR